MKVGADHEEQGIQELGGRRGEMRVRGTASIFRERVDVERRQTFAHPVVEGQHPALDGGVARVRDPVGVHTVDPSRGRDDNPLGLTQADAEPAERRAVFLSFTSSGDGKPMNAAGARARPFSRWRNRLLVVLNRRGIHGLAREAMGLGTPRIGSPRHSLNYP